MPVNDFLPFAIGAGNDCASQSEWNTSSLVTQGFISGILTHQHINKALRQSSVISAAVAQMIVNISGFDLNDDGDFGSLVTRLQTSISAALPYDPSKTYPPGTIGNLLASLNNSGGAWATPDAIHALVHGILDESTLTNELLNRINQIDNPGTGLVTQVANLAATYGSTASAAASAASAATSLADAVAAYNNALVAAGAAYASQTAAASSATDAATRLSDATVQANNAATSATSANGSAANASTSASTAAAASAVATSQATAAATSATNAATSATNAGGYASSAATSATSAGTAAGNASTSASSASTSATNAAASATTATTQASVAASNASAAGSSATTAANSANAAASSAITAGTAATNAQNSASSASTSATSAATHASSASTSASSASTSATQANDWADISLAASDTANTFASSASTSATNAASSASSAATSAGSASTASNNAIGSAANASTYSGLASTAAGNANNSAGAAAAYASQASTSASNAAGSASSAASWYTQTVAATGSLSAAVTEEATTRANADATLGAQYVLKAAVTRPDGMQVFSAIGLASVSGPSGAQSQILLQADKLTFVLSSNVNGTPQALFTTGYVGGIGNSLVISAALIGDLVVGTLKIGNNAVSLVTASGAGGRSGTSVTLTVAPSDIPSGQSTVQVAITASLYSNGGSAYLDVGRNASYSGFGNLVNGAWTGYGFACVNYVDNVGPGTYTYAVYDHTHCPTGIFISAGINPSITATLAKK